MNQLSDQQLALKEQLARTFLSVAQKILPGISRLKGSSLFELYLSLQQRAVSLLQDPASPLSPQEVAQVLETAKEHLQECCATLQYEPGHQPEGRLFLRAQQEMQQLQQLITRVQA